MNDFRPEDFDQAFGQFDAQRTHTHNLNRLTEPASPLTLPRGSEEQTLLEFETTGETARQRGLGLFHLRVVAFVIR